jgi:quercetin dioxygenase-like cupin family protein
MVPVKTFYVLGERVDVLVDTAMSNGASTTIVQHVPPGGGPPPHSHKNEEETFIALEGDFEILTDGKWHPLAKGESVYGKRGGIHTFRNVGNTTGRLLVFLTPGGFEDYLEAFSPFSLPADMPKVLEISEKYGITFHM